MKDELLYHRDKVLQQNVQQRCVPIARRDEVCHIAHDMCHQGYKRTKETLRLNFFLARCVKNHQGICIYLFGLSEKGESCYKRHGTD